MMNLIGRKYHINPETLRFEEKKLTPKKRARNILVIASGLVFLAFGMRMGYEEYAKSPRLVYYENKNEQLRENYQILNAMILEDEAQLMDLRRKDERLYRSIFCMDPLPSSTGIGGSPRNTGLQSISNNGMLTNVEQNLKDVSIKADIQSLSFDEVERKARENQLFIASKPSIQPISPEDRYWMTSTFGYRTDPFNKRRTAHHGIDLAGPYGLKIHATGNGTVVKAEYNRHGYGREVIIDHGFGYKTIYAHMQDIHVEKGAQVKRGQVIGTLGSTGRSTGPHLHYEIRFNKRAINPLYCFYEDITPQEYKVIAGRALKP
jgi:hypothetical protein